MRYPIPQQRDPLIQAIEDGTLTPKQASAVADVMRTVVEQVTDSAPVRPGVLMDLTIADATRYQRIVASVRANERDLRSVTA